MSFPKEFPKAALAELLKGKNASLPHVVLGSYELVGFGLYLYFGDVDYMPQANFDVIQNLAVTAETAQKIYDRAKELKAGGMAIWMIVITLILEYGPTVIQLIAKIRELLNKE